MAAVDAVGDASSSLLGSIADAGASIFSTCTDSKPSAGGVKPGAAVAAGATAVPGAAAKAAAPGGSKEMDKAKAMLQRAMIN